MIYRNLVQRYFEESFFIIPLVKGEKRPIEKNWNKKPLSYTETISFLEMGYNIGIVGGKQSRKDNNDLIILDFDGRLDEGKLTSSSLSKYRELNTLVQFTPKGFHVLLRMNHLMLDSNINWVKNRVNIYCKDNGLNNGLHRSTFDPKHQDNTFSNVSQEEHDKYFLDSIRYNSMYIVASPSKVDTKSYWWLDNMKGEILEL